ncbi:unnamed protein product [Blepharisma stoltei]|uniref:Cysteine proteinase n=1 Tax=Blepharisma stoltei TaxID=1481888 RepID=A0AAU9JYI4_9CILI|nr:unnamed protein product [Blepharisma stoltei]
MDNLLDSKATKPQSKIKNLTILGASIGFICLIVFFTFYSKINISTSALSQFNLEEEEFKSYILKYNKNYNKDEYLKRFKIFRDNLGFIHNQNALGLTWTVGINQFTDLTTQEFKAKYLHSKIELPETYSQETVKEKPLNVASSIDWRSVGAVTPVGIEGLCNSDYAFASVGAVEGIWKISGNPLVVLSEQEIVDCSISYGNKGCGGGLVDHAYSFIQSKGLTSALLYPYIGTDEKCNENAVNREIVKIQGANIVQANNPLSLQYQVATQPVSVYVDADNYVWQYYNGGVVTKNCGTELSHSVLIVGYNMTASPAYWIVKNSWGATWGESGYIRIGISSGAGVCGINMAGSYPTL